MDEKTQYPLEPEDSQWLKDLFDSDDTAPAASPEPDLPALETEDAQWLQDLLNSAETPSEPASEPDTPAPAAESAESSSEEWLEELFASAEQAAEQSFAPAEPEEEAPLPLIDLDADLWPAPASASDAPESPADAGEPEESAPDFFPAVKEEDAADISVGESEEPVEEDAAQDEEESETASEEEPEEVVKRRPRNKKGYGLFGIPHVLVTAVWLVIILFFGVFLGQWLWTGAKDVLAFGREDKMVTITLTESDDLDSLIEKLHSAGLINEPLWFRWYGQLTDVMEDIGTGTFQLNTLYDYHALVSHMSPYSSARMTVEVRIPEGYTCQQTFALLERQGVCSAAALEDAAVNGVLTEYWFLEGLDRSDKYCLEGYLYPDTYEFYVSDSPTRVLNTMLSNFNARFTDVMRAKLTTLNETVSAQMRANGLSEEYITQHMFTIREVVIIASLIEKESSGTTEGYTISSVIYNRLTNPVSFPYLEIDATLVYITGNRNPNAQDKLVDSPYNTYLYAGLIPGPICSPSRYSLDAALDPAATEYYFYALNPATGTHHFSVTYSEHLAFLDSLITEEETTP